MKRHAILTGWRRLSLRTLLARFPLAVGVCVLFVGLAVPVTRDSKADPLPREESAGGEWHVRVEKGLVTARIAGSSLDEVLRAIGAASGIPVVFDGLRQERISAEFQSVPLEKALRTLIRDNFLLVFGTDGHLVEVRVSGRSASVRARPSPAQDPGQVVPSGNDSFESLVEELRTDDIERRGRAILLLGESKDERALELVIGTLQVDGDVEVRQRALWALEDLPGPRAVAALADLVSGDGDEWVRNVAVEVLSRVGGRKAIKPLSRALSDDPDPFVRYKALVGLVEIGSNRMMRTVRQALNDPDELVRAKAEEILACAGQAGC